MKPFSQGIKLFIVLILSTAYVFGFSHIGVRATNLLKIKENTYPSGTLIAAADAGGKTESEAMALITKKISKWKHDTEINLQISEQIIPFDLNLFQFNVEESLKKIKGGQQNLLNVTIGSDDLSGVLAAIDSFIVSVDDLDTKKLAKQLTSIAAALKTGIHTVKLNDYLQNSADQEVLGQAVLNPKDVPAHLTLAIEKLGTIPVKPQSQFSLLETLTAMKLQDIPTEAASIIASGIYQVILTTNFTIIEKNTSPEAPDYVPLGMEARVDAEKNLDFVFDNPNLNSYTLKLSWESDGLHVQLIGQKFVSQYKFNASDIQYFSPKTVIQYSPVLSTGQMKVQRSGSKGVLIKVYREEYRNGNLMQKQLISEDFYPPIPTIEVRSLTENGQTTDAAASQQTAEQEAEQANTGDAANTGSTEASDQDGSSAATNESDLFGKPNEVSK
ncbi:VanW family protein [Neobacillus muris]|uniref:VanW family protein n=1 Tax=Neobacillus muris TaxID=2941334 RepID=UPI00203D3B18|nr:VanW family protein [Neobacillus muris]